MLVRVYSQFEAYCLCTDSKSYVLVCTSVPSGSAKSSD